MSGIKGTSLNEKAIVIDLMMKSNRKKEADLAKVNRRATSTDREAATIN